MHVVQSECYGMNTAINGRVFGRHAEEALQAAEMEISRLEGLLSRFVQGSEIYRLNRSAGISCEEVSSETFQVLSMAKSFYANSGGCFDVTIGPLVDVWKIGKVASRPPKTDVIRKALSLVDDGGLVLDSEKRTAGLKKGKQSIDLGGIGKGFAADLVLEKYKQFGISSAFANLGGNVAVLGSKPDGLPWLVGLRHPRKLNALLGVIPVSDKSVVTSGDYQRYFIDAAKRYHHILDPSTGYPAESGVISVTVVAENSLTADALSTALFVAGIKNAQKILKRFPGIEVVMVDTGLVVHITEGLKNSFQPADEIVIRVIERRERS